jgi:hypothetical protein
MSEMIFLPVNTPAGIFNSRTAFWLRESRFDADNKFLVFNIEINGKSLLKKQENNLNAHIKFLGVNSFECLDYDTYENKFGAVSKSNFDQEVYKNNSTRKLNRYLLWFYDNGFVVNASGYTLDGF